MRRALSLALVLLAVAAGYAAATAGGSSAKKPKKTRPAVMLAAGDIAQCSLDGVRLTADLVAHRKGTVAAIGDTVYPRGSASDFADCYAPTWGRFKARTRPAIGNHEYLTPGAKPYFDYFGKRAHPPNAYYSYRLGSWHIIVINSECSEIGGCGRGSAELRWLKKDLARHPARCTLAYWHRPRFSSGPHGPSSEMQRIWVTLAKARADVVLNGHDHLYQRFAPLNARGRVSPKRGMREFVVGTGGGPHYSAPGTSTGSRKIITGQWGVLRLVLKARRYHWQFLAAPGGKVLDQGGASCH
jgi:alkaline phosphatase